MLSAFSSQIVYDISELLKVLINSELFPIQGELANSIQNWLERKSQSVVMEGCFFLLEARDQWCVTGLGAGTHAISHVH